MISYDSVRSALPLVLGVPSLGLPNHVSPPHGSSFGRAVNAAARGSPGSHFFAPSQPSHARPLWPQILKIVKWTYIYILYIYHYYLTDFSQNGSDMQWWDNMRCNIYVKRCNQDVIRIFSSSLSTWDFSPYISLWHARPKFNHIQPIGFFVALRIEISDDFRLAAQCSPTNTLLSCPILWIG
jgi:hypothetical protein